MKKLVNVLLISAVMVFAGCEGDEGPQGPAGADGNANVKTEIIVIESSEWTPESTQSGTQLSYEYDSPILTENGTAHLYVENTINSEEVWVSVPLVSAASISSSVLYYISPTEGLVIKASTTYGSQSRTFKLVTVDADLQDKVDFSNHDEVMKTFNLNEEY